MIRTKLGEASLAALESPDGARKLQSFHSTAKGRPLLFDEARVKPPAFRGALLATAGAYRGRIPFKQVLGLVCGRGRVVLYDRFGLAAKWEEGSDPVMRRRGIKFSADRLEILERVIALPAGLLGYPPSWTCPSCRSFPVSPEPESDHFLIPLCEKCRAKVKKEKDWVGSWICFSCGDRVGDDVLECPWCARLKREG